MAGRATRRSAPGRRSSSARRGQISRRHGVPPAWWTVACCHLLLGRRGKAKELALTWPWSWPGSARAAADARCVSPRRAGSGDEQVARRELASEAAPKLAVAAAAAATAELAQIRAPMVGRVQRRPLVGPEPARWEENRSGRAARNNFAKL